MARLHPIVFLIDVDNTLLDNDGIQQDLKDHLRHSYGDAARDRYWRILEDLFEELGYRDYLGALQRYRVEHPRHVELLAMSSFLIDYPFANRLFPSALKVLKRLGRLGSTVILSDGDVVFQPHKVERSGLAEAVDGRVLIYIHKEEALDDVERRYPAERYVLFDDKLRILTAVKQFWGERVVAERHPTIVARLGAMFQIALSRDPSEQELKRWESLVAELAQEYQVPTHRVLDHARLWADVAHTLFNTKEFLYFR